ncbi:MAG: S8 family peptidase [Polyangiaceae bacterium]|nr:S8 family peptidase [Polyangiaceae bacterium]
MKRAIVTFASCAFGLAVGQPAYAEQERIDLAPSNAPTSQFLESLPDVMPGEIVVDVKDDLTDADIERLGSEFHIALRDNSPGVKNDGNIAIANIDASRLGELIARLTSDSRVEAVEPVIVAKALFTPNDPKFGEQWHMTRVGAERAWDYACGQGVTVAVVDTGIACYDKSGFMKGTDLAGTSCVGGYNFVGNNDIAADDQGHGTHVAGTIAQTTNNGVGVAGLAHCAKLMPVKVLSKQGWGTMADVAEGIRWAADHGANVVNLSLGSPIRSKVVENAVKYASKKGVVVVAAAGNSGKSVGYPAAYADVIAVSATDRNDNLAWFSSRGPEVAIGAPGVSVTQQTICDEGKNKCEMWGVFNGTSMASPHVAAAAALAMGQGITNPDAVREVLQATAIPKNDKNLFGAGILDAGKSVFSTHFTHVVVRLLVLFGLALAVARHIKRKGGSIERGVGKMAAALVAGVGLLPVLPVFGVPARAGSLRWVTELFIKPVGEWDLLFSAAAHKWLILASAAPTFLLVALFFGSKRLRGAVGGYALGSAALCVQLAMSGEVLFAGGPFMLRVFCAVNAAMCLWVARMTLDAKRI